MMTNKFNLDMRFLYQEPLIRDYIVGGGPDHERIEWENKYEKGEDAFSAFIKKCSLEDLIYVYLYAFKEKFPNILRLAFSVCNSTEFSEDNTTKYIEFDRSDITAFDTESNVGSIKDQFNPIKRDVYETMVKLCFNKTVPISAIEEALLGLSYTKEISNTNTIYSVENAPIKKVVVTIKSFTIYINEEKVVLYYKM